MNINTCTYNFIAISVLSFYTFMFIKELSSIIYIDFSGNVNLVKQVIKYQFLIFEIFTLLSELFARNQLILSVFIVYVNPNHSIHIYLRP